MRKKLFAAISLVTVIALVFTVTTSAFGYAGYSGGACTCHGTEGPAPQLTQTANDGTNATYSITTVGGYEWTVLKGSTKVAGNSGASGTFTVADGSTYDVWVAYGSANGGDSGAVVSISPIGTPSAPTTYTIAASAGANGAISPSGAQTVTSGDNKTFTITPNSGYHVASLSVDGAAVAVATSYTFSNVTANHTIAATFAADAASPTTFTITASAGANGAISPSGDQAVASGGNKTFTITPNSGYHVASLSVDGVSVAVATSYTFSNVQANHTIAATFAVDTATPTTFTITASAGTSGTISPSGAQAVASGSNATFTITPATGCHVATLVVDGKEVPAAASYVFTNVTADHTIAATFAANKALCTITPTAGANGSISPSTVFTTAFGGSITFLVEPDENYHVDQVLVDGKFPVTLDDDGGYTFANVQMDHTISATFALNTFDIAATAGKGGSISPAGTQAVPVGGSKTYAITPAAGYQISGVDVDGVSVGAVSSYTFSDVSDDHTIAATFVATAANFSITPVCNAGGVVTPGGAGWVAPGGSITFWAEPDDGYHIGQVLVDNVPVLLDVDGAYTFSNVQANHTISVQFVKDEYTLAASAGAHGTISPSATQTVQPGASVTYAIAADSGYHIADVKVDGVSVGALSSYTFSDVSDNHTIAATFAADLAMYTITPTCGAGGSITPATSFSCPPSGTVTFQVTPNEGYHVATVVVDGQPAVLDDDGAYTFANVGANHTIAVTFAIDVYKLTTSVVGQGFITPDGSVTANPGDTKTFLFVADPGSHLSDVLIDGQSVGAVASYTMTGIDSDHTIQAVFDANVVETCNITAMCCPHGTMTPVGTCAVELGGCRTYAIKADAGYKIADVFVDGVSVGAVSSYTFSGVSDDHTIIAAFVPAPPVSSSVSAKLSVKTVKVNRYVTLSGKLSGSGSHFGSTYVYIERKFVGSSKVSVMAKVKVSSTGTFSWRFKASSTADRYYRVRFAGNSSYKSSVSSWAKLVVK